MRNIVVFSHLERPNPGEDLAKGLLNMLSHHRVMMSHVIPGTLYHYEGGRTVTTTSIPAVSEEWQMAPSELTERAQELGHRIVMYPAPETWTADTAAKVGAAIVYMAADYAKSMVEEQLHPYLHNFYLPVGTIE